MRWSGWDIVVVTLFALQLGAWTLVFLALSRIKDGPIAGARRRAGALGVRVAALRTLALQMPERLVRLQTIAHETARARQSLHLSPPEGMVITPATLQKGIGAVQTARAVLGAGRRSSDRKRSVPRRSVAQRLGLLPPIVGRLGWLGRASKIAWRIVREARRRR